MVHTYLLTAAHSGSIFYRKNRLNTTKLPSARDGASVGPDVGACTGGLLSWTGLLGIPCSCNTHINTQINTHVHFLQATSNTDRPKIICFKAVCCKLNTIIIYYKLIKRTKQTNNILTSDFIQTILFWRFQDCFAGAFCWSIWSRNVSGTNEQWPSLRIHSVWRIREENLMRE